MDAVAEAPPAPTNHRAREPEKLLLPTAALERLLRLALRTELGALWWDGYLCAHGYPGWTQDGRWRLAVADAHLLPADRAPDEEG